MELKEIIQKRIDRLESVPDAYLSVIDKENERLFKEILSDLNALEIKDGKIIASKNNLAKVNLILEKLKISLFNGEYLDAVKKFAGEIQTQATLNNSILKMVVGSFTDNELYKSVVLNAQHNALLLMDENAIAHNVMQPLSEILSNSIINAVSYNDAVDVLKLNMVGDDAVLGKYAKTIVVDTFSVADRQYVQLTAKQHSIEFWKYDGGKVRDTRYFCCVRSNKIFHTKEVEEWGNHPSLWTNPHNGECEKAHGGGMNADTNSATIFSYLGGYNCRHVLIPKATEYVPADVIARAKEKGYLSS